jgi:hypothetical protein
MSASKLAVDDVPLSKTGGHNLSSSPDWGYANILPPGKREQMNLILLE